MIRRLSFLAVAALLCAPALSRAEAADSDPQAMKVAHEVLDALGGGERWNALTGIAWTFEVSTRDTVRASRRHVWNKHSGEHRVEYTTPAGVRFVVVHVLGDSTRGSAWANGTPLEGDSLHHMLKRAYAMWVNDSYWFLMPYKLLDPGVHLGYDGQVSDSAGTFDRLALSFDHVGLTPGDHYWVDVARGSERVERWKNQLQNTQPPPTEWTWEGWEKHDGLWFPTAHRRPGAAILTRDVETYREMPASAFAAP